MGGNKIQSYVEANMKERLVYADSSAAIARLKNNGLYVDTAAKTVEIPRKRHVGIKLWGAIDYLMRFHNYCFIKVI
jgi:hypothetical protein